MNGNEQILKVENLTVRFNSENSLDGLSFDVNRGDVLAVIGPNGAGKTTLFKALLGMISYEGKVEWAKGLRIGYVPQRMNIEHDIPVTVFEFLRLRGKERLSKEKAKEALSLVSLPSEILGRGFGIISAGQRQRVLIAWALLNEPDVLLFDEPTADVDIAGQDSIYQLLHNLEKKFNLTIILISHELNVVYKYAEKVLCLNKSKICFGAPNEILNQEHLKELYGSEHGFYHHQH